MNKTNLILQLFDIGAIQFGSFKLKSGITSPIYLDLRRSFSQPHLLSSLATRAWELMKPVSEKLLCPVPYGALPFATALCLESQIPLIFLRKEKKEHGTNQLIEGIFQPYQGCVLLEDIVTTGSSVLETALRLREEKLQVTRAYAIVDRGQGGKEFLEKNQIELTSLFSLTQLVHTLLDFNKITPLYAANALHFIESQIC